MGKIFLRKKFTNYLGENRAINDIVSSFTADPSPTPPSITPTPTPSITPTSTLTPTPTPSITPTTTITPSITPSITPTKTTTPTPTITPTNTTTPTPTPTPVVYTTFGAATSLGCGAANTTGGTFSITYNSVQYNLTTTGDSETMSAQIPIQGPAPGVVYTFDFNNDPNFTLCNLGSGPYQSTNKIVITVGSVAGSQTWNSVIQFYNGASLVYQDNNDIVSMQNAPYNLYNINFNVQVSLYYGDGAGFAVAQNIIQAENLDYLQTESGDFINKEN